MWSNKLIRSRWSGKHRRYTFDLDFLFSAVLYHCAIRASLQPLALCSLNLEFGTKVHPGNLRNNPNDVIGCCTCGRRLQQHRCSVPPGDDLFDKYVVNSFLDMVLHIYLAQRWKMPQRWEVRYGKISMNTTTTEHEAPVLWYGASDQKLPDQIWLNI